jgi:hypothetical protein
VTSSRLLVVLGLVLSLAQCVVASRPAFADEPCLDAGAELGAAGRRKGVQKRDFLKRLRLEL